MHGRIKVLVIDDEEGFSCLMRLYLEDICGFETRVAHCGREGLALFEAERPDAVLLDLNLPDQDGLEVARGIVERCGDPAFPLFLITASIDRIRKDGREAPGVISGFRVFTKPLDPSYVASLIRFCARGEPLASGVREPPLFKNLGRRDLFDLADGLESGVGHPDP